MEEKTTGDLPNFKLDNSTLTFTLQKSTDPSTFLKYFLKNPRPAARAGHVNQPSLLKKKKKKKKA